MILTQAERDMSIEELRQLYIEPLATLDDDCDDWCDDWCDCHGFGRPCLFKFVNMKLKSDPDA
jgi:hypothetical protein